jgi:uncharacterized protein Yka (UPF0111/DUF47 family)
MTVKQLRDVAKSLNIVGRWDMTKPQLLEAISNASCTVEEVIDTVSEAVVQVVYNTEALADNLVMLPESLSDIADTVEDEASVITYETDFYQPIVMALVAIVVLCRALYIVGTDCYKAGKQARVWYDKVQAEIKLFIKHTNATPPADQ